MPCRQCSKRYMLADGRYQCSFYEFSFQEYFSRWINHGSMSCIQWLSIIKLFE